MPKTSPLARKAARHAYKQQSPDRGIFSVRCSANGRTWVGASPNLYAAHNGAWFMLRSGGHRNASLQADWRAFGESAFTFEVLETLDDDVAAMRVADLLKQKKQQWADHLGATPLL